MKNKWLYILIFIPVFSTCLENPEMTTGIVNGKEKPTVLTDSMFAFYEDGSLLFQGTIISEGKSKITERGFYWSNDPNDIKKNRILSNENTNFFTCKLEEVSGNTTYYWCAFAKNSSGEELSELVRYNTTPVYEPKVETSLINPIIDDGVLLFQGVIRDYGRGAEIIKKGFYWDTVLIDKNNEGKLILSDTNSDTFSCELKKASGDRTYYWRAFAENRHGIEYGEVRSKDTPEIWDQKRSCNFNSRGNTAIFVLNNNIYLTCGHEEAGALFDNTWEYSITENEWGEKKNFDGGVRINPVAFTIGNFAFVGTGQEPPLVVIYKDFYRYDIVGNKWTEIATPDEFEARYEAAAFSLNGKGYIVGGRFNRVDLKDVWRYDPEHNSWERKNDFPTVFSGGISICGNNRVFAGFGTSSESVGVLWEYNEKTDNWTKFSTLPDNSAKSIYSGVIIKNVIYIVDINNEIWTCNMDDELKTWKKKADLPSVFLYDNKIGGNQKLFTIDGSNSIYVGLGFSKYLFEYKPLWDN